MVFSSGSCYFMWGLPQKFHCEITEFPALSQIIFPSILFLVVFIFVSCLIALFLLYYGVHIYASS